MPRNYAQQARDATATDDAMELWRAVVAGKCPIPRMFETTDAGYIAMFFDDTLLHRYGSEVFASSPDFQYEHSAAPERLTTSSLNRLIEAGVMEPMDAADAPPFPESRLDALKSFLAEVDLVAPLASGRSLSEVVDEAGYFDVVDVETLRDLEGPTGYHVLLPLRDGRWLSVAEQES